MALWRRAHSDGSYLSASDSGVHFGLGTDSVIESVDVHWPSGLVEHWTGIEAENLITLEEGASTSLAHLR